MQRFSYQCKSRAAVPARREYLPVDTGYFVWLGMFWVMHDAVDARMRNFVSRLIHVGHCKPPVRPLRLLPPPCLCRQLPDFRAPLFAQAGSTGRTAFQPAKVSQELRSEVLLTGFGHLAGGDLDNTVSELVRVNGHV